MRLSTSASAALFHAVTLLTPFLLPTLSSAADDVKKSKPCAARSPTTDRYFDLTPIWVKIPEPGKESKNDRTESWHSRGYDIGYNFTLNFCGPVIEKLGRVEGVDEKHRGNISAYYEKGGRTYSMGMQNAEPVFRGRKLVLNYTEGSPCGEGERRRGLEGRALKDGDDEDEDEDEGGHGKDKGKGKGRRKQTIISLLCETDALQAKAAISFVAASEDECTYFFEARSSAACSAIEKEVQTVGPAGLFTVILFIAIAVYIIGGCVYQRNVMHQRGWRQLPNYALWAGIGGFIRDMFIILTSSCARFLPRRRGYNRVSLGNGRPRGNGSGGSHAEDENRLIDQLDEEWDD